MALVTEMRAVIAMSISSLFCHEYAYINICISLCFLPSFIQFSCNLRGIDCISWNLSIVNFTLYYFSYEISRRRVDITKTLHPLLEKGPVHFLL